MNPWINVEDSLPEPNKIVQIRVFPKITDWRNQKALIGVRINYGKEIEWCLPLLNNITLKNAFDEPVSVIQWKELEE